MNMSGDAGLFRHRCVLKTPAGTEDAAMPCANITACLGRLVYAERAPLGTPRNASPVPSS